MSEVKYRRYIKASIFKRFTAFIGDLFILIMGVMLISAIVSPLTTGSDKYIEAKTQYDQLCLESKLYEEKDGKVVLIKENIDQALTYFYSLYDQEYGVAETYNAIKAKSSLFTYDSTNEVYVEVGSELELKTFYENALYEAVNLHNQFEAVTPHRNIITTFGLISMLTSICIPGIIFFYVVPLLSKGKSTICKRVLGLTYISERSKNHQVSKLAYTLNFFLFALVCSIGYGILLLVNAAFIFFNYKGQSFCDYNTGLILVDKNQFFSNSQKVSDISIPYEGEEGYLDELE